MSPSHIRVGSSFHERASTTRRPNGATTTEWTFRRNSPQDACCSIHADLEVGRADNGCEHGIPYTHLMPSSAERTRKAIDAVFTPPSEASGDVTSMQQDGR